MEQGTREEAPGRLRLVQDLVNTADLETGEDQLASETGLLTWLAAWGIAPPGPVGPADLAEARDLREALRELLLANGGSGSGAAAAASLGRIARRAPLRAVVGPTGAVDLLPAGAGVVGLAALVLACVHEAQVQGIWTRLKACPASDCRYAFYDHSRNRSGTWCTMRVCGSRAKARAYQGRLRAARAASQPPACHSADDPA
ncbi:MAG TPA: CGNR zinc finger domain-containing protein [Verrucomicrobiae bacterium]|nr:CGNR zinc finger domain-containing protein [Verrucomicrobiae bacterium]